MTCCCLVSAVCLGGGGGGGRGVRGPRGAGAWVPVAPVFSAWSAIFFFSMTISSAGRGLGASSFAGCGVTGAALMAGNSGPLIEFALLFWIVITALRGSYTSAERFLDVNLGGSRPR